MAFLKKYIIILCLISSGLFSSLELKESDVRQTFEEMLGFHVEHQKMKPLLIARSLKLFVERFDSLKMYFTESEIEQFFHLSKKTLEKGVEFYYSDDLSLFTQTNSLIQAAVKRARQWRYEIQRELILSALNIVPMRGETYLAFAYDELQLKSRMRKRLIRLLMQEKELNGLDNWTPRDREKIFSLWEGRFARKETGYLSNDQHYLSLHTLKALSLSLDAHTAYFSPEEALGMRTALIKQFEGVGVVLREGINGVVISDLVKGGPAERSGKVFPGDRIIKIDGLNISGMDYSEVLDSMKGQGGKELRLTLSRKNSNQIEDVFLIREKIMMSDGRLKVSSVPCNDGQIGILTLPSFYEGGRGSSAEGDIREAIKKLKRKAPLEGIILDMRENAGGFLTQAVKVSGLFITKGVVVISKYSRGEIKYLRNLDGRLHFDGPLIILTSRASASAAEIVAQALQDYGVALIVGDEETYGKGTIQYQTVTDESAKAFYKVTVGRYYTVSGRSTQIEGVKADIVVPTIFSSYKIGERYLEYPLPRDQVASAYIDPLTDIDYKSRSWFQKNYLPNIHTPQDKWKKALPMLKENSARRLENDENFVLFAGYQEKLKGRSARGFRRISDPPWGDEDLQLKEALNIMKDMVSLPNQT